MKDFTIVRPKHIEFSIDEDVFFAWPSLPVEKELILGKMGVTLSEETDYDNIIKHITSSLEIMMVPDSYKVLAARMNDQENPVNVAQLSQILEWLSKEISGNEIQEAIEVGLPLEEKAPELNESETP